MENIPRHTFSELQLRDAVKNSTSIRQVILALGFNPKGGGNYQTINKLFKKYNIDISHFTGSLWSKGRIIGTKVDIQDYLSNKRSITSHKLRLRLIKLGLLKLQCSSCLLSEWQNKTIPLELDHIDGNHLNNNLSNLRLLCPNCHAQTPTHAGKNKGKGLKKMKCSQ